MSEGRESAVIEALIFENEKLRDLLQECSKMIGLALKVLSTAERPEGPVIERLCLRPERVHGVAPDCEDAHTGRQGVVQMNPISLPQLKFLAKVQ